MSLRLVFGLVSLICCMWGVEEVIAIFDSTAEHAEYTLIHFVNSTPLFKCFINNLAFAFSWIFFPHDAIRQVWFRISLCAKFYNVVWETQTFLHGRSWGLILLSFFHFVLLVYVNSRPSLIKYWSGILKNRKIVKKIGDVIFSGKNVPAGRYTTSHGACK